MDEFLTGMRRHPVVASILAFVVVSLAGAINSQLGALFVLGWFALVGFFIFDRPYRRAQSIARPSVELRQASLVSRPAATTTIADVDAPAMRVPIPPKLRFDIFTRDNYTCQYCGTKGPQAGGAAVLEIDHRLPVAHGGTNDPVNLVTACADCNRGKGATRLDATDDPGRTLREHQWETCSVTVRMEGDNRRQSITISAMRYGAGKSYWIIRPKVFQFEVSLPPGGIRNTPTLESYTMLLKDKDRWKLQNFLDLMDAQLKHDGWQQTSKREWRRIVR